MHGTHDSGSLQVGGVVGGRYQLEGELGTGAMGSVYRASILGGGGQVAVKVLRPELVHDARTVARFEQEARAVGRLRHPNVVQLIDVGRSASGELYFVMELAEGVPLSKVIAADAPLPMRRIIRLARQIALALREAHEQGFIHRDLKPDNIIVTRAGQPTEHVKVLDFGVAKDTASMGSGVTATGMVVGTPGYMSPEQANARPVTMKADLYALGAIVYELLTGRPVFPAETVIESMIAHVHQTPEPPIVRGQRLTGPVVDIVMRCLEKAPEARPTSADAILGALDDCEALLIIEESRAPSARVVAPSRPVNDADTVPPPHVDALAKTIPPPDGVQRFGADVAATVLDQRPLAELVREAAAAQAPPAKATPRSAPAQPAAAAAPARAPARPAKFPWLAVVFGLAVAGAVVAALTLAGF